MLTMVIFCGYTGWNPLAYFWGQLRATAVPEQSYHPAHPGTSVAATAKAINLEAHFLKDTEVVLQLDNEVRAIYTRASTANWEADASLSIEFAEPSSAVLRLNGQPLRRSYISWEELQRGGELSFELTSERGHIWY